MSDHVTPLARALALVAQMRRAEEAGGGAGLQLFCADGGHAWGHSVEVFLTED